MSAASTPLPRSPGSSSPRGHSLFWPIFIYFFGAGVLALYQVLNLEDRLDSVTRASDQLDAQVKRAQYERTKFFTLAKGVLDAAPKDPTAQQIVTDLKLDRLQATEPTLIDSTPSDSALTNAAPASTNAPAPATTNAAAAH